MTEIQIQLYLSQIWYVSPLERIRYYLRAIRDGFFSMFSEGYVPDPEYDEGETADTRRQAEIKAVQKEAEAKGIKGPKR